MRLFICAFIFFFFSMDAFSQADTCDCKNHHEKKPAVVDADSRYKGIIASRDREIKSLKQKLGEAESKRRSWQETDSLSKYYLQVRRHAIDSLREATTLLRDTIKRRETTIDVLREKIREGMIETTFVSVPRESLVTVSDAPTKVTFSLRGVRDYVGDTLNYGSELSFHVRTRLYRLQNGMDVGIFGYARHSLAPAGYDEFPVDEGVFGMYLKPLPNVQIEAGIGTDATLSKMRFRTGVLFSYNSVFHLSGDLELSKGQEIVYWRFNARVTPTWAGVGVRGEEKFGVGPEISVSVEQTTFWAAAMWKDFSNEPDKVALAGISVGF